MRKHSLSPSIAQPFGIMTKAMARLSTTLVLIFLASVGHGFAEEYLDWTSTGGITIRAKLVRDREGMEVLLGEDGKQLEIRRDQLGKASRQQLDELIAATNMKEGKTDQDGIVYKVPTFADGEWRGYHAVYEREKFVALATRSGAVHVFMKDGGKRIPEGQHFLLRFTLHYPAAVIEEPKITLVEAGGEPSVNPEKLSYIGSTDAGTTFEITYLFEDESIALYWHLRDPRSVKHPTTLRLGARFPRIKGIDPRMAEKEIEEIVGYSWIKARTEAGDDLEFDFIKDVEFTKNAEAWGGLKSASGRSEVCGPHPVKIESPNRKFGLLRLWNATQIAPHTGFSVNLYRSDPGERSSRAQIQLEIE